MYKEQKILIYITVLSVVAIICLVHFAPKFNFDKRIKTISKVISAEACGEGRIGMHMVANTIVNRAREYRISPYDVVIEPNQYAGLNNLNIEELYFWCGEVADDLVSEIFNLPDLTDGALYFKRPEEERKPWHKVLTVTYMNHEFYK